MYKKILVPLDGSELAECVLPHVEAIVNGCGAAEIVFVRAVEAVSLPYGAIADGAGVITEDNATQIRKGIDATNESEAVDYLSQLAKRVELKGSEIKTEVLKGKIAESLAEYATQNDYDLVIIATHGRSGISRWVWGSVADRLLRSACVPVLMIRGPGCVLGI